MESATNIVEAGSGLEVGNKLELLGVRQAEAHAEQAQRLTSLHQSSMQRSTARQPHIPQVVLTPQLSAGSFDISHSCMQSNQDKQPGLL